jgi:hypothetical protein
MLLGIGLEVVGGGILQGHGGGVVFMLLLVLMLGKTHLVLFGRGSFAALGIARDDGHLVVGAAQMMTGKLGFLGIVGFGGHKNSSWAE